MSQNINHLLHYLSDSSECCSNAVFKRKRSNNNNKLKALFFFSISFCFLSLVCTALAVLACLVSEPKTLFRVRVFCLTPPHPVCRIKAGRVHPLPRLRWDRDRSGISSASADLWLRQPRPAAREVSSSGPGLPAAVAAGRPAWTHPSCWQSLETEERPGPPGWPAHCLTQTSCGRLGDLQARRLHTVKTFALKGDRVSLCHFISVHEHKMHNGGRRGWSTHTEVKYCTDSTTAGFTPFQILHNTTKIMQSNSWIFIMQHMLE